MRAPGPASRGPAGAPELLALPADRGTIGCGDGPAREGPPMRRPAGSIRGGPDAGCAHRYQPRARGPGARSSGEAAARAWRGKAMVAETRLQADRAGRNRPGAAAALLPAVPENDRASLARLSPPGAV